MRKRFMSWVLTAAMLLSVLGGFPLLAAAYPVSVCQVGETGYATFGEALTAAGDGDTITLLADIYYYGDIVLINTNLNIDLGTYYLSIGTDDSDGALTVDGGALTIDDADGGKLLIQRGKVGLKAVNGGSAVVSGVVDVDNEGVEAEGGSTITVKGDITTDTGGAMNVESGASVHVTGDIDCYLAVMVRGSGSSAVIDGSVTGHAPFRPATLYVDDGASVAVGGDVHGVDGGVYCAGGSSAIIKGDVTSSRRGGVSAYENSDITVGGSVTSVGGLRADGEGSAILVKKNTTTTDDVSFGAYASNGAEITVEGTVTAANFIMVGDTVLSEADGELEGHHIVYSDGVSSVFLKGIEFFKEDFEDESLDGWAFEGTGWSLQSGKSHSGDMAMRFNSGALEAEAEPVMYQTDSENLTHGTAYWLEFWLYQSEEDADPDDRLSVRVSKDAGVSWDDLGTFNPSDEWAKVLVDLADYAGESDVRIAFVGVSDSGKNIYIDDVTVSHECLLGCRITEAYGGYIASSQIGGETYYHVSTPEQLAHIGEHSDKNFIQTADIDLAGYNGGIWTPIGSDTLSDFTGKYDGGGCAIDSLDCSVGEATSIYAGLFSNLAGVNASISNLKITLTGADISTDSGVHFGTVAGGMKGGTIKNCDVVIEGDVVQGTKFYAGGIVGRAYELENGDTYAGLIENCSVTLSGGSIINDNDGGSAGGIAGFCANTIKGCTVTVGNGECIRANIIGGIVGAAGLLNDFGHYLENCKVIGGGKLELMSQSTYGFYIGGIAGSAAGGEIRSSKNEVPITSQASLNSDYFGIYAGGIAGDVSGDTSIIGCDNAGAISLTCSDSGVYTDYDSKTIYTGGIVGRIRGSGSASTIENCQNNASVTAVNLYPFMIAYAGGIAGYMESGDGETDGVTIKNCANISADKSISATAANTFAGGIAGFGGYTDFGTTNIVIENCYNRSSVESVSNGAQGEGESCIGLTAGGIVGAADKITVTACYSTAAIVSAVNSHEGDAYFGGVVGVTDNSTFTENYCEQNAIVAKAVGGITTDEGIVPQSDVSDCYQCATTQNLKTKSFYGASWKWYTSGGTSPDYYSAATPWRMTSSSSYPALRGVLYTAPTTPVGGGGGGGGGIAIVSYTITATAGAGGSVTPSGSVSVEEFGSKSFSVSPDAGYKIADVLVDGRSVGAVAEYTFEKVTASHSIEAKFEKVRLSGQFTDVDPAAWYADGIEFVLGRSLFKGVTDTAFEPDTPMTRGMLITVLHRLAGNPAAKGSGLFSDVEKDSWFEEAVNWASGSGIVTGSGDMTFGPNAMLTREQLAVILYRYAEFSGYDVSVKADLGAYSDASGVSDWAVEAMRWAVAKGLITGSSGDELDAGGLAVRAQVATILMRFIQMEAD